MNVLRDILNTVTVDATVTDVRICLRATMVVSQHLGLSYTFPLGMCEGRADPHKTVNNCGSLTGMSAMQLARYALSDDWTEASVGVAAINSLITPDPKQITSINGVDILLERAAGAKVAMVGHFPFSDKIKEVAKELCILELRPDKGDLDASEASRVIPKVDVVIVTGTTLINHTFENIAEMAKKSYMMLLGPTTILSPVLFDYGADAICGVRVVDPALTIRHLSEGGSFRRIQGTEQIALLK
ncbi:MAG: DUF364 domain-containing protein [Pseudomonadota bacterium]